MSAISITTPIIRCYLRLVRTFRLYNPPLVLSSIDTFSHSVVLKLYPDALKERISLINREERDPRLDTPVFVFQLSFPGIPTNLHIFEPR